MLGCPGSGRGAWHNQCFDTSQMVEYTTELVSIAIRLSLCFSLTDCVRACVQVSIIRAADPVRPITSGYSAPRPSAWHNEHSNFTGAEFPFWSTDNVEQYTEILLEQNKAVDIISLHLYRLRHTHAHTRRAQRGREGGREGRGREGQRIAHL